MWHRAGDFSIGTGGNSCRGHGFVTVYVGSGSPEESGIIECTLGGRRHAAFELGECFDLILVPGHSFQFMLTPADQVACLTCIRRHLAPGGKLVVHLNHDDLSWLGALVQGQGTDFAINGEYRQNSVKGSVRAWTVWSYEASTQTASAVDAWDFIGEDGVVMERRESETKRLHCVFRFEMEHLLARTGFEVEALYGDFSRQEFQDTSSEMVWVACPR